MKKKVLVTGADGYIGRHVVLAALESGCQVVASDLTRKGVDERADFTSCAIFSGDPDLFHKMGQPDILIHLAWRDGFIHNSTAHMADLSSHVVFLNNMIDAGIQAISVMGSMHEVGYWEGAITEDTPCNPQSQYGVAKNALRQSMFLYGKDKPTLLNWLRAYYIYGDDAHGSSVFAKIVQAAGRGQKTFPFTSGKNLCDFISVQELGRQIVAASMQQQNNGILNVCSGKPESLADRVEAFIRENRLDMKLEYGAYPDRPYDSPGVWGDSTKIDQIMEEALKR